MLVVKEGRGKPLRIPRPVVGTKAPGALASAVTVGWPSVSRRHWRNFRADRWRSHAVVSGSNRQETRWWRSLGCRVDLWSGSMSREESMDSRSVAGAHEMVYGMLGV